MNGVTLNASMAYIYKKKSQMKLKRILYILLMHVLSFCISKTKGRRVSLVI